MTASRLRADHPPGAGACLSGGRGADPGPDQQGLPPAPSLQAVLDALPAGVVVLDGDGRIVHFNAAASDLLGDDLFGSYWREIIRRAFASQQCLGDLKLADGRLVTLTTNPLGTTPGQVILISDVTETRALQLLAQRRQRLSSMGEMAASLAHQIRTPLATSLLYVSQLERAGIGSGVFARCVGKVRTSLDHLDRLVRDMLLFARDGAFPAKDFSVTSVIETFRQMAAPRVGARACRLDITDQSAGAWLRGNPDALLAAWQNILENALEACSEDASPQHDAASAESCRGRLEFSARKVPDQTGLEAIEFLLKDNGPGIAPAVRVRILDPFFTTKARGTGLGLAVVQAVVQAHHGALWIASEPGCGTTVVMRLPLAAGIPGSAQVQVAGSGGDA